MHLSTCSYLPKQPAAAGQMKIDPPIQISPEVLAELIDEARRLRAAVERCRAVLEDVGSPGRSFSTTR